MEQQRLTIAGTSFQRVDLWIDVTVGYKKVQPGVVIHVKKSSTPADIGIARLPDPRGPAHIIEAPRAVIVIQRVRLLLKVTSKKAQAAAVVVIAEIHAHVPKFETLATQRHATQQTD